MTLSMTSFSNPCIGPEFQKNEATTLQDNQHMQVARLSTLNASRLYPSGNIPGIHLC